MADANLTIQVIPHAFPLEVKVSLIGEGIMTLTNPEAKVSLNVPLAAWPWLTPGEQVVASLTLFRTKLEEVPVDLSERGLIIPGGVN